TSGEPSAHPDSRERESVAALVDDRSRFLAEYQDGNYAQRYRSAVNRVVAAERRVMPGSEELTRAAAVSLHKLMAYKDEYEVARLYSEPAFLERLSQSF